MPGLGLEVKVCNTLCASGALDELTDFQAIMLPPVINNPALISTRVYVGATALEVTISN